MLPDCEENSGIAGAGLKPSGASGIDSGRSLKICNHGHLSLPALEIKAFLSELCREAAQTGVDKRRPTECSADVLDSTYSRREGNALDEPGFAAVMEIL
jgi:hypothetical protein